MYVFYLGKLRLPIAPPKLTTKIQGQNKTLNLIDGSEINVLKKPGLTEISFEARFPPYEYYFASFPDGFKTISSQLEYLEYLKQLKRGFQFVVYRNAGKSKRLIIADDKNYFTNIKVSLEDYSIVEDANDGLDTVVSINLKQYVKYGTKEVIFKDTDKSQSGNKKQVTTKKKREEKETGRRNYVVVSGDNLWNLSRRFYGDESGWRQIYEENRNVIEETAKRYGRLSSSNGWWIYPGTVLVIPAK